MDPGTPTGADLGECCLYLCVDQAMSHATALPNARVLSPARTDRAMRAYRDR